MDYRRYGITYDIDRMRIGFRTDADDECWLAARAVVCERCTGRGVHDNENLSGYSRADFDEDPDLEETYRSGMLDVICEECRGARVTLEPADPMTLDARRYFELIDEIDRVEADDAAERRHFDRGL